MLERLLRAGRGPGLREGLVAAGLLALLATIAYAPHVAHGGFYSDDWANAADYRFADAPRYLNTVSHLEDVLGGRPLMALMLPAPHVLFGLHPSLHLALAAALGALTSLCFFVCLRTLEMPPLHAVSVAALALLFPWSDSLRLWPAASLNSVAVCFFLVGLTLALRGFEKPGRRGTVTHALAALLYLLAILTYEVTAAAALLAALLYLGRAPRPAVLRAWLADLAAVAAGLVYSLTSTVSSRHVGSLPERIGDIPDFSHDFVLLLASALQPFGTMGRPLQALVLLLAAAIVAAALLRLRRRDDPALRFWLRWMLIGLVAVGAAYFMFLGSHLQPLDPGIDNRINVFAGLGICLLVYALVACAAHLLAASRSTASALTVALVALLAIGYGTKLAGDEADWRDAAERQASILTEAEAELLPLPRRSIVLSFGLPAQAAPEVPIFHRPWDLGGALKLLSDGAVDSAYPVYGAVALNCGRRLRIDGGGGYGRFQLPYRGLYAYEPGLGRAAVRSRARCRELLPRLQPGPVEP